MKELDRGSGREIESTLTLSSLMNYFYAYTRYSPRANMLCSALHSLVCFLQSLQWPTCSQCASGYARMPDYVALLSSLMAFHSGFQNNFL